MENTINTTISPEDNGTSKPKDDGTPSTSKPIVIYDYEDDGDYR